jgi:hypothetical protein
MNSLGLGLKGDAPADNGRVMESSEAVDLSEPLLVREWCKRECMTARMEVGVGSRGDNETRRDKAAAV